MGFSVGLKGDLKKLAKKLETTKKDFDTGKFLEETAQLVNSSIQIRVQKDGKGVLGKKMNAYSGKYGTFKQDSGRNISFRDLTFSGTMWESLTTSKARNQAKMFFGGAESVNKASGNHARTPFFGVGPREKRIIRSELKKLIDSL